MKNGNSKLAKQPDKGSLASIRRDMDGGGGINIYYRITIVCQAPVDARGRACCNSDAIDVAMPDAFSFGDPFSVFVDSRQKFVEKGWRVGCREGVLVLCPECKRKSRRK